MNGVGASPGIAVGRVYLDWKEQVEIDREFVDDVEAELERLDLAIETVAGEMSALCQTFPEGGEEAGVAPGTMLRDGEFIGQIKGWIITENVNAPWAVKVTADKFVQVFENMDNDDLKARADDVKDVASRLCRLLLHVSGPLLISRANEPIVLVCRQLDKGHQTMLQRGVFAGVVCQKDTYYSHGVISARNCHVPTVISVDEIADLAETGDPVILDGTTGEVILNPSEDDRAAFAQRAARREEFERQLSKLKGHPARSRDGTLCTVHGNVADLADVDTLADLGGGGIGLYRTEYLYLSKNRLPTCGEQYGDYRRALLAMTGCPVIFRTLDIGGDRIPDYLAVPKETNPALGHRAIRYSLSRSDIFREQLRALLRASGDGDLGIMLPLVTSVEEVRAARAVLEDLKNELRREDEQFNPEVSLGVMVETPAAALTADVLARESDFLSIGSNDLVQYTLAADRANGSLGNLYSPFAPAVLRLIKMVIDAGDAAGTPVHLCGEMAGVPTLIPVLFGMGLRHFSVNPTSLLRTNWVITQLEDRQAEEWARQVLGMGSETDVRRFCEETFGQFCRTE
ncbi:phosphoenolpyruvate--protein phosphotransferase [Jonquetella anthropi]|uniref:phosphoenolpyruvate--protein phosphotransferase n=1 Tax=Jonquetella anthropi TaxID=428712 RepID=UPI0001B91110|nr:phosphoenolpyruvate--protein phosphotransferase [Jonquetella anthropi]EEX48170.1 phosphoenolpyruvate-protein phosphotransferase [Jonquetella anthropi E3_33 E1]